jgi:hypothetical protein
LAYLKQQQFQALAKSLTKLLDQYGLREKIIAYIKDEGSNVATSLWPSVGVKPNIWKSWGFGVLRDS